ncbi:MAG: DNA-binding response regulator, partial [Acidimicrobiales bacterium]
MTERIPVFVYAADPISQAGLVAQLRGRPEVLVVADGDVDTAAVAVILCDDVDDEAVRAARAVQRNGCPKLVLVATRLDDAGLLRAAETGASGLLRRGEASPERLVTCVRSAVAGDGAMPPDLLG